MNWSSWWSVVWTIVLVFAFVAYLIVLFMVLTDLFRDHSLNAFWKVIWIIALIVVPYLSAFIYLIARGNGMAARSAAVAQANKAAADEYIRKTAGVPSSPAENIAAAKNLLDTGVISQAEFDSLKAKALA